MSRCQAKLKFCAIGLVSCLTLMAPTAVAAKNFPAEVAKKNGAVKLLPSTPWHLEMADDRCRLARKFGREEAPSLVAFEQIAPGRRFDLTVAGPDIGKLSVTGWKYRGLRSDREMATISPLAGEMKDFGTAWTMAGVSIAEHSGSSEAEHIQPSIDPADARQVERIVIQQATNIVSFETGGMEAAFEALNACAKDLIPLWGLSLQTHEAYKPPRMLSEKAYFSRLKHQFAKRAGVDGHKALLRVRVLVAADGSVTDCHFEYPLSTGGAQTDVCEDIRQMQFEAAENHSGDQMPSFYVKSIVMTPYSPWTADAHGGRWEED